MSDLTTLGGTRDFAWGAIMAGVQERAAPCRFAVLATAGDGGAARMVVLRGADRVAGSVEVHSDLIARKVEELRAEPRATLLFWLPAQQVQIRLRARFAVLSGEGAATTWQALPEGQRRAYGGLPVPGTPIDSPADHDADAQPERFAILRGEVQQIETLHLGTPHARALFTREGGFAGRWIAP